MTILETSQIVFNVVASLTILVVGLLLGVIAWEVIMVIKRTKRIANDIKAESVELYKKLDSFLLAVGSLSFVSKLFNKKSKKNHEK